MRADFKRIEEQIVNLKERGAREHLLSVLNAADTMRELLDEIQSVLDAEHTMRELLDENRRLRKLLSMWLRVNDWDEGVGGLRWNTIVALTKLQEEYDG
jgi:hypothetical protein